MNVSKIFIERPIATSLLMFAIALFGIVAYRSLPVSDLPNVEFPTILVTASLPGANPDTMASAVATPLERQFSTIAGIDSMSSTSSLGATSITLQFDLSRSIDAAAQDVQSMITLASPLMPPGMPSPPTFRKVNPADQPVIYLAVTSKTMPLYALNEFADTMMSQRISMVPGVAQVQIFGSQKYAVHVQVDPRAMASRRIGIDEVETAVRKQNVNIPTGVLYGPDKMLTIQATGQLTTAAQYRNIVIAYRNGSPVRLSDIGTAIDSVEDDKTASWYNTHARNDRAIVLAVQKQPGTNTMEVSDSIKRLLPSFRAQMPPTASLEILYDRSDTIRDSFKDIQFTMVLALGLVVMVIFLFLRNVPATIIPSLALPFSVIGTFAVMYLCDYSLDNLSMMALILAIGFVVDDAIVMLENIVRHMELGEQPLAAALIGSREVGFTIVSMTLSLAAVFIPLLFMSGILGRLFREFSVTIVTAILISGVVSVTLTPMLSSRFLRAQGHGRKHSRIYLWTEGIFDGMLHLYERSLHFTLRHRPATLALSFVILAATGWLFVKIPKGFLPSEDTNQIMVITEAAQGASHLDCSAGLRAIAEIARQDPNIEEFMSQRRAERRRRVGGRAEFRPHVPAPDSAKDRRQSADELIDVLRPKLNRYPGHACRFFRTRPASASAAPSPRACTNTRSRGRTSRSSTGHRRNSNGRCPRCRG